MATAYRYHSIEPEGLWTSEPFPAAERRHIVQGVIAGFLSGRPRWATTIDGTFIYGLDAKGKEMKAAPAHETTRGARTHAAKKSPAQLQREIDEVLAKPVTARAPVPKWQPNEAGFEAGFEAGKEQARHDASPRETLRQLRAHARTDFERGLVAGYESIYDNNVSESKPSHATRKTEGPWVTARKTSGATVIERQMHGCDLTVIPVDWAQPRGSANWSVTCRHPQRGDFDHARGQAATVKGAKQAAMRAARAMAAEVDGRRSSKAQATKKPPKASVIDALQDLLRDYEALRAQRDRSEPSTDTYTSIERRLAGMRRQADKLIHQLGPSSASWRRAFGLL